MMKNVLDKLKQQIDNLETQVLQSELAEFNESYFDEQLFSNTKIKTDLAFYLGKIQQTYQAIVILVAKNEIEPINYFSDMLVNQISALNRELVTHQLRYQEPIQQHESLTEKHSRHLDYLRRLENLKYESQKDLQHFDLAKIAAIDNRIYRCNKAIKQIEIQLEDALLFEQAHLLNH